MKKIFILISFVTLAINTAFSQKSGVFQYEVIEDGSIKFNIYLYQEGVYEFNLFEKLSDDIISTRLISLGNYSLNNEEVILTDKYNGFQMLFIFSHDTLIAIKSFKSLLDKNFIDSKFQIYENPNFSKYKIKNLEKVLLNFNKTQNIEYPFRPGYYENEEGFTFFFQINKYSFEYRNIILSEGTWEKKGNELILLDSTLNYSFYILIYEKSFISKFLPRDIEFKFN